MSDITSQQLVVFWLGCRGVRPPDRRRPRDHPLHRAPHRRFRADVDPRRHRPPRQDHPDLRPRLAHGLEKAGTEPGKIVIVESGTGQVGVMVDEVEEVLTARPSSSRTSRAPASDAIDAIAKVERPAGDPAEPGGPVRAVRPPRTSRPPSATGRGTALQTNTKRRVVVADDSRLMRRMLADALAQAGLRGRRHRGGRR